MGKKKELKFKKIACAFAFYLANNYEFQDDTEKGLLYKSKDVKVKRYISDIYDEWLIIMNI